jgi:hypothetical protein
VPDARQFDHRGLGEQRTEVGHRIVRVDAAILQPAGEHGGLGLYRVDVAGCQPFEDVLDEASVVDVEGKLDAADAARAVGEGVGVGADPRVGDGRRVLEADDLHHRQDGGAEFAEDPAQRSRFFVLFDPLEPGRLLVRRGHAAVAEQGVHQEKPFHPLRMADGVGAGDRPAPVLADEGDFIEPQVFDQRFEILDMGAQRVGAVGGCLRLPEAHVVGNDDAVVL